MKTYSTSSHRDRGDHLVISETPWPIEALRRLVSHYSPIWAWDYTLWNAVLCWCARRERTVLEVPVEHACDVAAKLWGRDAADCYHEHEGGEGDAGRAVLDGAR